MKRLASLILAVFTITLFAANWFFVGTSVPAGYSPAQEGAAALYWWRSDTLTKDGSNAITGWTDKSPNGYTVTIHGSPTWVPNVLGGKPCAYLDGDDYFEFAAGVDLWAEGSERTLFFTVKPDSPVGTVYRALVTNRTATTDSNFAMFFSTDSNYSDVTWNIYQAIGSPGVRLTSANFYSGTNGLLRYNGGTRNSPSSWAARVAGVDATPTSSANGQQNGNHNYIGEWAPVANGLAWVGYVCEIGLLNYRVDDTRAGEINTYETGYWGN